MAGQGGTVGSMLGTGLGALLGTLIAPGVGTTIGMGLGGTFGGGLGGLFDPQQAPAAPRMLNPEQVAAWNTQLQQMLGQNGQMDMGNYNSMKSWMSQGQGYMGNTSALLDQMANFKPTATYDPQAATRQFLSNAPMLQDVAKGSIGAGSLEGDMALLQGQALRDVAAQFGPDAGNSGAFQASAMQAMAQPRFQAAQQRQALEANAVQQLLGQGMANAESGQQFLSNLGSQQDQMRLSGLGGAAQGYSGLTQSAMQGAGIFGNIYGQQLQNQQSQQNTLLSLLGAMSEPVWYTDPMVQNGGGFSGSDAMSIANLLAQLGQGTNPLAGLGGGGAGVDQLAGWGAWGAGQGSVPVDLSSLIPTGTSGWGLI